MSKLPKKTDMPKLSSKDAANVFKELINAKKEYELVREQEVTKRQEIAANLNYHLEKLSMQRDMIENYLEKDFAMRKETIDEIFSRMDRAYNDQNYEVVIKALDSVEGIVKQSPMADMFQMKKIMSDDSLELEI